MSTDRQGGFEDLDCYQLAVQVMQEAYRVVRVLPVEEKYNLASQIRRSAVSSVLNIAEGYGRYHYLDSLRFFYIARGSLTETLSAFVVCDRLGYGEGNLAEQRSLCHQTIRSLNGYIRYVRTQQQGAQEFGHHVLHESQNAYEIERSITIEGHGEGIP
ncbi:MAG: four helix bundle protein [Caldilineales bacterium]